MRELLLDLLRVRKVYSAQRRTVHFQPRPGARRATSATVSKGIRAWCARRWPG